MDAGDSHTIGVECWHSGYSLGNGAISTTFKVSVTANSAPSIWLHCKCTGPFSYIPLSSKLQTKGIS